MSWYVTQHIELQDMQGKQLSPICFQRGEVVDLLCAYRYRPQQDKMLQVATIRWNTPVLPIPADALHEIALFSGCQHFILPYRGAPLDPRKEDALLVAIAEKSELQEFSLSGILRDIGMKLDTVNRKSRNLAKKKRDLILRLHDGKWRMV